MFTFCSLFLLRDKPKLGKLCLYLVGVSFLRRQVSKVRGMRPPDLYFFSVTNGLMTSQGGKVPLKYLFL